MSFLLTAITPGQRVNPPGGTRGRKGLLGYEEAGITNKSQNNSADIFLGAFMQRSPSGIIFPAILGLAWLLSCGGSHGQSSSGAQTAVSAPAFSIEPTAQRAILGKTATFLVRAVGNPTPTCCWQQTQDGVTWNALPDSQALSLDVVATNANNGNSFRAIIANSAGTAYSSPAQLLVGSPPVIISQPTAAAIIIGNTVTFTVTATGQPTPSCQWQSSKDGLSWTSIPGATGQVYSFTPVAADIGSQFAAVLSNWGGTVTTVPVSLNLWSTVPVISSFSADPPVFTAGQRCTLSWAVKGAATLSIDPGVGTVTGSATAVTPTSATTYTLTATNAQGSVTATARVGFFEASVIAGVLSGEGNVDGFGTAARFYSPFGVATDPSGNVFVADGMNSLIRKITSKGQVITVAGQPGQMDANGLPVGLSRPGSLALDSSGTLYFVDSWASVVRKITPAGVVSTYAGSGALGGADGPCASASFNNPLGVALDASGNVYVADMGNHAIREISTEGKVTTLAGLAGAAGYVEGQGTSARFFYPSGVAVDAAGNVLVSDSGNSAIRKITPGGLVSTFAGSGQLGYADGTGSGAQFWNPTGVTLDGAGNLYVTELQNHTIRLVTPAGVVSTLAGSPGVPGFRDGAGNQAGFNAPSGIAVDSMGQIIVADSNNNAIRLITPTGMVSTLAGMATAFGSGDGLGATATFNSPLGIATDGKGTAYVVDSGNRSIRRIAPAGAVSTLAGSPETYFEDGVGAAAGFAQPTSLTLDPAGNVYVIDFGRVLRKISVDGRVTSLAGSLGTIGSADGMGAAASFDFLCGLAIGPDGNIYAADLGNNSIRRITPEGVVTTFAGASGLPGESPSVMPLDLNSPSNVIFDPFGNLFIATNCAIHKLTPQGELTTLAGSISNFGNINGTGAEARFGIYWLNMAMDGSGNLYVADTENNAIRMITPVGVVSTLAGSGAMSCNQVEAGKPPLLWRPQALAWDATTNSLLVTVDHAVIKLTLQQ